MFRIFYVDNTVLGVLTESKEKKKGIISVRNKANIVLLIKEYYILLNCGVCGVSLANDNFCFHYLRHPPPPRECLHFSNTALFTSIFLLGGTPNFSSAPSPQQVFVNAPLQDYQITNPTPLTPQDHISR